jgi:DNA-binding protein H-NS
VNTRYSAGLTRPWQERFAFLLMIFMWQHNIHELKQENMAVDLDTLSLDDLKALQKKIEKAITSYEDRQRKAARIAAESAARELGYSLDELTGGSKIKKFRQAPKAKYRHPENAEMTWSGRGRRPKWISDAVEKGQNLEDFAI